MFQWFAKIIPGPKRQQQGNDTGFTACANCTTGHTPACTKIDAELAAQLGLTPNDPQYSQKLREAKRLAFGD